MKKGLLIGSLALNVLFIIGALILWLTFSSFVEDYLANEYKLETDQYRSFEVQDTDIVMLGDSITDGGQWYRMFPGLNIENQGIAGDTTAGVLTRLDLVTKGAPEAIFIKIGTNDLGTGVPLDQIAAKYREIVTQLKAQSPDTDLFLQSVLPRESRNRRWVEALNAEIQSIAAEFDLTYIDLYSSFLSEDGSIADHLSSGDELHLSVDGYKAWASELSKFMPPRIACPPTTEH